MSKLSKAQTTKAVEALLDYTKKVKTTKDKVSETSTRPSLAHLTQYFSEITCRYTRRDQPDGGH